MPKKHDKRLGDMLVEAAVLPRATVEEAAQQAAVAGRKMGTLLAEKSLSNEREVYRQLAEQHGLSFSAFEPLMERADRGFISHISRTYAEAHHVVPLSFRDGHLLVATIDQHFDISDLQHIMKARSVEVCLVTPTDFGRLRMALELAPVSIESGGAVPFATADLLASQAIPDERTVALFNALLLEAIGERASDIHLEVYGTRVRVRMRVDGELRDISRFNITRPQLLALTNIIKVNARLDIAERRAPQGGRFTTRAGERVYDLRVQTQPSLHGEHVVLRFLPQGKQVVSITELGFPPAIAKSYRRLLENPAGLVLVVGPTGSGKSTTVYAGLQSLAQDVSRKVITVEDPIEYSIDNVQQTQAKAEIGFTFATAMRAFVREDPDVIFVGEIRDGETALEALRASQTGHLVLSTLHCNDTVDAIQRLFDLGMHPNSIASELTAIISQRLAKRICEHCRGPWSPPQSLLEEVFPRGIPKEARFFHGAGCERCSLTGSMGRIAVVEYLTVDGKLRHAISRRAPLEELKEVAHTSGLIPLRRHALALVYDGTISLEDFRNMMTLEQMGQG